MMPRAKRYVKSSAMIDTASLTPEQRTVLEKYKAGGLAALTNEERKLGFPGMIAQRVKSGRR